MAVSDHEDAHGPDTTRCRSMEDVVAASLVGWFHGIVSARSLRVVAEDVVADLVRHLEAVRD